MKKYEFPNLPKFSLLTCTCIRKSATFCDFKVELLWNKLKRFAVLSSIIADLVVIIYALLWRFDSFATNYKMSLLFTNNPNHLGQKSYN